MDSFTCKRCNHISKTKQALEKHLMRKKVCQAKDNQSDFDPIILLKDLRKVVEYKSQCTICSKEFSCERSLRRHLNICRPSFDNIKTIQEQNERISKLEKQLEEIQNKNPIILSQTNIQNTQNISIQVHNFGEESLAHLTNDFLDKCLFSYNSGLKTLMKEIHFNPDKPENQNIRCLSKKNNILETFSNGAWHPCDKNNTLDLMIKNGYRILFRHFANNHIPFSSNQEESQRHQYINEYFTKIMRKEGSIYYELRRDLYMLILDGDFYIIGK